MKLFGYCLTIFSIVFVIIFQALKIDSLFREGNFIYEKQINILKRIKEIEVKQSLDIQESRTREGLLLKEVGLLQYQIDVLTEKELK